jgi:hypothetical protein
MRVRMQPINNFLDQKHLRTKQASSRVCVRVRVRPSACESACTTTDAPARVQEVARAGGECLRANVTNSSNNNLTVGAKKEQEAGPKRDAQ